MTASAPFVAMRTDLRKDERVNVIADLGGYNRHEAIGRLFDLWAFCADRGLQDAPDDCDGYAVPEGVVRRFLGARGVDGILGDGCDELALGERRPDGLIYLRGTSEAVSRRRGHQRTAVSGGLAQRDRGNRGGNGRFVGNDTIDQLSTSREPAVDQQLTSSSPAVTSVRPQTTNQSPEEELPPAGARAIPPSTEHVPQHGAPAPEAPVAPDARPSLEVRQATRDRIWRKLADARRTVAAELGLGAADGELLVFDSGKAALANRLALASDRAQLEQLERQADKAIAVITAEARAASPPTVEWLTGAVFESDRAWRRAAGKSLADAARGPRAGPRGHGFRDRHQHQDNHQPRKIRDL